MSLKLYRPSPDGLEPSPVEQRTWRSRLRLAPLEASTTVEPELQPTSSRLAVFFWIFLATATFFILLIGYGLNIWGPLT